MNKNVIITITTTTATIPVLISIMTIITLVLISIIIIIIIIITKSLHAAAFHTPKKALNARPVSTAIVTPDPVTAHRPGAPVGSGRRNAGTDDEHDMWSRRVEPMGVHLV